jgi:hypothetical protein
MKTIIVGMGGTIQALDTANIACGIIVVDPDLDNNN